MMPSFKRLIDRRRIKKTYHTINREQVRGVLNEHLPEHRAFLLYGKYTVPKLNPLKTALSSSIIKEAKFQAGNYDCENFALHLHSVMIMEYECNACGLVVSRKSDHVFNVFIARDNGMYQVYEYKDHKNKVSRIKSTELPDYVIKGQTLLI